MAEIKRMAQLMGIASHHVPGHLQGAQRAADRKIQDVSRRRASPSMHLKTSGSSSGTIALGRVLRRAGGPGPGRQMQGAL